MDSGELNTADVALLLRYADRFVKEKNYDSALEAIAKARVQDPRNLYALAYEERVRSLLKLKKERELKGGPAADPSVSQVFTPALEHLSALAKEEAKRTEARDHAPQRAAAGKEDRNDEGNRRQAIDNKIESLLSSAEAFRARNEYQRALDEVTRALLLDQSRASTQALKAELLQDFEEQKRREDEDRKRRTEEEDQRKQDLLRAETERVRREKEERASKEEEARHRAQQEKVRQYLDRSRDFLTANRFDAALNELAFVLLIDPMNEDASTLQAQIHVRQEEVEREEAEKARRKEEDQQKRREAISAAIARQCSQATMLAEEGKYSEALRVVTRAYVIDPANGDVQKCEQRIITIREEALRVEEERRQAAEEEERRQREDELQRLEREERERLVNSEQAAAEARRKVTEEQIDHHLSKARHELSLQRYDNALAEIALAFLVDPFDEDVRATEEQILAAQEHYRREHAAPPVPDSSDDASAIEQGETVDKHLAEASRLLGEGEYDLALEELTRAFILDPLSEAVQSCEQAIEEARRLGARPALPTPVPKPVPSPVPPPAASPAPRAPQTPVRPTDNLTMHILRAREYYAAKAFEEALAEVALGLTLQADNTELQQLEREIWEVRHPDQAASGEPLESEADHRVREEGERLLQIHLLAAEEFQKQNDFARSLDELAKAYVIDPMNAEIKKLEIRIRQNQARQNPPAGQALKLVYPNERVAGGSR